MGLVGTLARDLRYAVRTSRRDAALTTFATLIIGVGVGVSTTVFAVVNALWLRATVVRRQTRQGELAERNRRILAL